MHAEIGSHIPALVDRKAITAIYIAWESGDEIILSRSKGLSLGSLQGDDALVVVTRKRIVIYAFQFYLGDARHLEIQSDAAERRVEQKLIRFRIKPQIATCSLISRLFRQDIDSSIARFIRYIHRIMMRELILDIHVHRLNI